MLFCKTVTQYHHSITLRLLLRPSPSMGHVGNVINKLHMNKLLYNNFTRFLSSHLLNISPDEVVNQCSMCSADMVL